jgi:15-cis-phytoene synthase
VKDRDLVRLYWPAELRPAFDALFAIDDAMGGVVAKATEPALAAIKLAWWRERLQDLDAGKAPAEPRLQAAANELLTRGVTGAALAELEEGWPTLLEPQPDIEQVGGRGAHLFGLASRLLGDTDALIPSAGRLYACESVRRRGLAAVHWPMDEMGELAGHRFARSLRPLTALAKLAARDARRGAVLEPEGTPGRAWALIAHRLTGRIA